MAISTINKNNIKVALVDDHVLIRNSLAKLVTSFPNCTVLFEADNGRHCIEFLNKHIQCLPLSASNSTVQLGKEVTSFASELRINT